MRSSRSDPLGPALWLLSLVSCGGGGPELPPNVLLVSWDTVRRDHLSGYGYERPTTPFLDGLAAESVVFDNAYTTASFTLIAHMSMLTGLYPRQHGVVEETALSPEIPLLAQRLRERSYYTVAVFRGGWIDERFGYDRGFDVFEEKNSARTAGQAMEAALAARPPERPVFLFLHLFDAHCGNLKNPSSTVYDPPAAYADLFRPGAAERLRPHSARDLYYGVTPPDEEQAADLVALYDGAIRYLDDRLAEWVELWRREGLFERSLFLLTSDHGEALGQRGPWSGHGGFWEEGLRIPLVVRFPDGHGAGTRDARLTSVVDFVPTVLDVLELPGEPWLAGSSLRRAPLPERVVLAERERLRVVTDGRWKLHMLGGRERLFDLDADPGEQAPLEGDAHETALAVLRARLDQRPPADVPGEPIPAGTATEEERSVLEGLGYAGEAGGPPDEDGAPLDEDGAPPDDGD